MLVLGRRGCWLAVPRRTPRGGSSCSGSSVSPLFHTFVRKRYSMSVVALSYEPMSKLW